MLKFIRSILGHAIFIISMIIAAVFTVIWVITYTGLWSIVILCGLIFMALAALLYNESGSPHIRLNLGRKEKFKKC